MSSVHTPHPPNASTPSLVRPPSAPRNRSMPQTANTQPELGGPSLPSLAYDPFAVKPSMVSSSKHHAAGLPPTRIRRAQPGTGDPSPTSETSSPVSARINSNVAAARGRQSSLKELVDRFEQTPDALPPIPRKAAKSTPRTSRAPSARPSPRDQTKPSSQASAQTSFEEVAAQSQSSFQEASPVARVNGSARRMSSTSPRDTRMRRISSNNDDMRSNLSSPTSKSNQRPLFGEIVATGGTNDAGFGIRTSYRRRGSEGSMHSPNPMFPPDSTRRAPWSLSNHNARGEESPASEEILTDDSNSPTKEHRRARSEFASPSLLTSRAYDPATASSEQAASASFRSYDDFVERPPPSPRTFHPPRRKPISQISIHLANPPSHSRDSQSRIPLSSRRLSGTSDSATSPPASRANSSIGGYSVTPQSSTRNHHSSAQSTPHHRQVQRIDQRGALPRIPTSPTLNAYIQAPLPKKSPPLRSSRPRQHVSNATTAASRARNMRSNEESRTRRPPDIGGLDFAARRQRIQQAFNKSMSDRDRHREQHRKRQVPGPDRENAADRDLGEKLPSSQHVLTVETGLPGQKPAAGLDQEDSPTLGIMTFDQNKDQDPEPSSAVTAETSDSVDTFFDDEPQDDSDEEDNGSPDLLTRVKSLRESSPSSRQSTSGQDDRESIQIMLGETPVLRQGSLQPSNLQHQLSTPSPNSTQAGLAHLSMSTMASDDNVPAWSPETNASSRTARTTMDSDAYSTINRVLDHYHDPSVVSPAMMNDIQQHIYTTSPDLARQGGWDPKKVTQLYLQELARSRFSRSGSIADGLKRNILPQAEEQALQSDTRSQPRESMDEKVLSSIQPGHSRSTSLEISDIEVKPQRASMNHPDDWNMSPSIVDWIAPQAADSPSEEKPPMSVKDSRAFDLQAASEIDQDDRSRSQLAPHTSRPELPEIQGTDGKLGLAINVTSPQDDDSPVIAPPPLPNHEPPPPPISSYSHSVDGAPPVDQNASPITPRDFGGQFPSHDFTPKAPTTGASSFAQYESEPRSSYDGVPILPQQSPIASAQSSEPSGIETPESSLEQVKPGISPDEHKRLTQRGHAIREFVDTEHSFGQDMIVVDDIYKGTSSVIVSEENAKVLFGNSDQIVAFSATFLDALKKAAKSTYVLPNSKRWKNNRQSNHTSHSGQTDDQGTMESDELNDYDKDRKTFIGEAFRQNIVEMEKVYGSYVKNLSAANEKLQVLQKDKSVVVWLRECRAFAHDLTTAWDLDSLLVKPVQRILKYHLMLTQLLQHTPEDHPDSDDLKWAANEMRVVGDRLNELKRRQEVISAVHGNRKRKESDVRTGLAKAFGRRAEKFKQDVIPIKVEEDKEYTKLAEKYGDHFFQLQVVMRDVEMYTKEVDAFVNSFNNLCIHVEDFVCVEQSSYPELESKWRKFRMLSRDMLSTALPDHVEAVRKHVIEPMTSLLKLHGGPQKFMAKREKRFADYARFKTIKARGDKPDKKTTEQSEQYQGINDTLKKEIPKLFALTGRLVEACLHNLVQIQRQWDLIWQTKLSQAIEGSDLPKDTADIITSFSGDFAFHEAQALTLGICNGSLRAEAPNLVGMLSPSTTLHSDDQSSLRRSSATDSQKRRTMSLNSDASPQIPPPDLGTRAGRGLFGEAGIPPAPPQPAMAQVIPNRARASSNVSNSSGYPDIPGAYHRSWSNSINTSQSASAKRPSTATARSTGPPLSRPSIEVQINRQSEDSYSQRNRSSSDIRNSNTRNQITASPTSRYSNFFSSAMPMSDSPHPDTTPMGPHNLPSYNPLHHAQPQQAQQMSQHGQALTSPPPPPQFSSSSMRSNTSPPSVPSSSSSFARDEPNVIFLAASVYEFNIDHARREAGFPYLTYSAGEIFDVLGEKGELWLARNQDDRTKLVGWIWNKHFVKLAS